MGNLNFSRLDSTILSYEAVQTLVKRFVDIHLERKDEGRVKIFSRYGSSQEWILIKNAIYPANCNIQLDLLVPNKQIRIVSQGECPVSCTIESSGGSEGVGDGADVSALMQAIEEQARINAEQQMQIDSNTETNQQQSESIVQQAAALQDNTTLASEESVSNLFK